MGATPNAKFFSAPQPFGASPNPNVLSQTQNAVQLPTQGMGYANMNQQDSGITTQPASPTPAQGQPSPQMSPAYQNLLARNPSLQGRLGSVSPLFGGLAQ